MLLLNNIDVSSYKSNSQKIRVLTENWVQKSIFCPVCTNSLTETENNSRACDFICNQCKEEFELKSKNGKFGNKIVNGAYQTLLKRVKSNNNPNLYLLNYNAKFLNVTDFLVIPKYFFTENIIEERKPLSVTAKRAGWIGSNIIIKNIPEAGRIYYIKNNLVVNKESVISSWKTTSFLDNNLSSNAKGWLIDTMLCVDRITTNEFKLDDIYQFEIELKLKYPNNNFIKDKLRQQLQILRDQGILEFLSRGYYRKLHSTNLN